MKVCEHCGRSVADATEVCPSCAGLTFKTKCGTCGAVYDGATCPRCAERAHSAWEATETEKANAGLWWKIALTVFLPFIGGFFTITPHSKLLVRAFGIFWCALVAVGCSFTDSPTYSKVASFLLCLLPIAVYLYRRIRQESKS